MNLLALSAGLLVILSVNPYIYNLVTILLLIGCLSPKLIAILSHLNTGVKHQHGG